MQHLVQPAFSTELGATLKRIAEGGHTQAEVTLQDRHCVHPRLPDAPPKPPTAPAKAFLQTAAAGLALDPATAYALAVTNPDLAHRLHVEGAQFDIHDVDALLSAAYRQRTCVFALVRELLRLARQADDDGALAREALQSLEQPQGPSHQLISTFEGLCTSKVPAFASLTSEADSGLSITPQQAAVFSTGQLQAWALQCVQEQVIVLHCISVATFTSCDIAVEDWVRLAQLLVVGEQWGVPAPAGSLLPDTAGVRSLKARRSHAAALALLTPLTFDFAKGAAGAREAGARRHPFGREGLARIMGYVRSSMLPLLGDALSQGQKQGRALSCTQGSVALICLAWSALLTLERQREEVLLGMGTCQLLRESTAGEEQQWVGNNRLVLASATHARRLLVAAQHSDWGASFPPASSASADQGLLEEASPVWGMEKGWPAVPRPAPLHMRGSSAGCEGDVECTLQSLCCQLQGVAAPEQVGHVPQPDEEDVAAAAVMAGATSLPSAGETAREAATVIHDVIIGFLAAVSLHQLPRPEPSTTLPLLVAVASMCQEAAPDRAMQCWEGSGRAGAQGPRESQLAMLQASTAAFPQSPLPLLRLLRSGASGGPEPAAAVAEHAQHQVGKFAGICMDATRAMVCLDGSSVVRGSVVTLTSPLIFPHAATVIPAGTTGTVLGFTGTPTAPCPSIACGAPVLPRQQQGSLAAPMHIVWNWRQPALPSLLARAGWAAWAGRRAGTIAAVQEEVLAECVATMDLLSGLVGSPASTAQAQEALQQVATAVVQCRRVARRTAATALGAPGTALPDTAKAARRRNDPWNVPLDAVVLDAEVGDIVRWMLSIAASLVAAAEQVLQAGPSASASLAVAWTGGSGAGSSSHLPSSAAARAVLGSPALTPSPTSAARGVGASVVGFSSGTVTSASTAHSALRSVAAEGAAATAGTSATSSSMLALADLREWARRLLSSSLGALAAVAPLRPSEFAAVLASSWDGRALWWRPCDIPAVLPSAGAGLEGGSADDDVVGVSLLKYLAAGMGRAEGGQQDGLDAVAAGQGVLQAMVQCLLSRRAQLDVRAAFSLFDLDGDGSITVAEFEATLAALGLHAPPEVVRMLVQRLDANGDGEVQYHEFVQMVAREEAAGRAASALSDVPADSMTGAVASFVSHLTARFEARQQLEAVLLSGCVQLSLHTLDSAAQWCVPAGKHGVLWQVLQGACDMVSLVMQQGGSPWNEAGPDTVLVSEGTLAAVRGTVPGGMDLDWAGHLPDGILITFMREDSLRCALVHAATLLASSAAHVPPAPPVKVAWEEDLPSTSPSQQKGILPLNWERGVRAVASSAGDLAALEGCTTSALSLWLQVLEGRPRRQHEGAMEGQSIDAWGGFNMGFAWGVLHKASTLEQVLRHSTAPGQPDVTSVVCLAGLVDYGAAGSGGVSPHQHPALASLQRLPTASPEEATSIVEGVEAWLLDCTLAGPAAVHVSSLAAQVLAAGAKVLALARLLSAPSAALAQASALRRSSKLARLAPLQATSSDGIPADISQQSPFQSTMDSIARVRALMLQPGGAGSAGVPAWLRLPGGILPPATSIASPWEGGAVGEGGSHLGPLKHDLLTMLLRDVPALAQALLGPAEAPPGGASAPWRVTTVARAARPDVLEFLRVCLQCHPRLAAKMLLDPDKVDDRTVAARDLPRPSLLLELIATVTGSEALLKSAPRLLASALLTVEALWEAARGGDACARACVGVLRRTAPFWEGITDILSSTPLLPPVIPAHSIPEERLAGQGEPCWLPSESARYAHALAAKAAAFRIITAEVLAGAEHATLPRHLSHTLSRWFAASGGAGAQQLDAALAEAGEGLPQPGTPSPRAFTQTATLPGGTPPLAAWLREALSVSLETAARTAQEAHLAASQAGVVLQFFAQPLQGGSLSLKAALATARVAAGEGNADALEDVAPQLAQALYSVDQAEADGTSMYGEEFLFNLSALARVTGLAGVWREAKVSCLLHHMSRHVAVGLSPEGAALVARHGVQAATRHAAVADSTVLADSRRVGSVLWAAAAAGCAASVADAHILLLCGWRGLLQAAVNRVPLYSPASPAPFHTAVCLLERLAGTRAWGTVSSRTALHWARTALACIVHQLHGREGDDPPPTSLVPASLTMRALQPALAAVATLTPLIPPGAVPHPPATRSKQHSAMHTAALVRWVNGLGVAQRSVLVATHTSLLTTCVHLLRHAQCLWKAQAAQASNSVPSMAPPPGVRPSSGLAGEALSAGAAGLSMRGLHTSALRALRVAAQHVVQCPALQQAPLPMVLQRGEWVPVAGSTLLTQAALEAETQAFLASTSLLDISCQILPPRDFLNMLVGRGVLRALARGFTTAAQQVTRVFQWHAAWWDAQHPPASPIGLGTGGSVRHGVPCPTRLLGALHRPLEGGLQRMDVSLRFLGQMATYASCVTAMLQGGVLAALLDCPLWAHMEKTMQRREAGGALGISRRVSDPGRPFAATCDVAQMLDSQWAGAGFGLGPALHRGYDDLNQRSHAHDLWVRCLRAVATAVHAVCAAKREEALALEAASRTTSLLDAGPASPPLSRSLSRRASVGIGPQDGGGAGAGTGQEGVDPAAPPSDVPLHPMARTSSNAAADLAAGPSTLASLAEVPQLRTSMGSSSVAEWTGVGVGGGDAGGRSQPLMGALPPSMAVVAELVGAAACEFIGTHRAVLTSALSTRVHTLQSITEACAVADLFLAMLQPEAVVPWVRACQHRAAALLTRAGSKVPAGSTPFPDWAAMPLPAGAVDARGRLLGQHVYPIARVMSMAEAGVRDFALLLGSAAPYAPQSGVLRQVPGLTRSQRSVLAGGPVPRGSAMPLARALLLSCRQSMQYYNSVASAPEEGGADAPRRVRFAQDGASVDGGEGEDVWKGSLEDGLLRRQHLQRHTGMQLVPVAADEVVLAATRLDVQSQADAVQVAQDLDRTLSVDNGAESSIRAMGGVSVTEGDVSGAFVPLPPPSDDPGLSRDASEADDVLLGEGGGLSQRSLESPATAPPLHVTALVQRVQTLQSERGTSGGGAPTEASLLPGEAAPEAPSKAPSGSSTPSQQVRPFQLMVQKAYLMLLRRLAALAAAGSEHPLGPLARLVTDASGIGTDGTGEVREAEWGPEPGLDSSGFSQRTWQHFKAEWGGLLGSTGGSGSPRNTPEHAAARAALVRVAGVAVGLPARLPSASAAFGYNTRVLFTDASGADDTVSGGEWLALPPGIGHLLSVMRLLMAKGAGVAGLAVERRDTASQPSHSRRRDMRLSFAGSVEELEEDDGEGGAGGGAAAPSPPTARLASGARRGGAASDEQELSGLTLRHLAGTTLSLLATALDAHAAHHSLSPSAALALGRAVAVVVGDAGLSLDALAALTPDDADWSSPGHATSRAAGGAAARSPSVGASSMLSGGGSARGAGSTLSRRTGFTSSRGSAMNAQDVYHLSKCSPAALSTASLPAFQGSGGGGFSASRGGAPGAVTHAEVALAMEWQAATQLLCSIVGDQGFVRATVRYVHEVLRWRCLGDGLPSAVEAAREEFAAIVADASA